MKKAIMSLVIMATLLMSVGAVMAGNDNEKTNNGQAIGQDPYRLALTKCSNAGIGNGGEYQAGIFWFITIEDDCLEKHFPLYNWDELNAIMAQSGCEHLGFYWVCEIDPGNSAAHNANNYK